MNCKKGKIYTILALILFFMILFFAPNKDNECNNTDVRKWIFLIVCSMGVLYFIVKTIIVIFHETIQEKDNLSKRYAIPVAAYTYMLFSIFFISFFIYNIYKNDFLSVLSNFIHLPNNHFYYNLFCSTTYLVITAFVWNFSKSFFTINALEYGVVGLEEKGIKDKSDNPLVKNTALIVEIIIRMIVATCFILAEQHLSIFFNECRSNCERIDLLCQIKIFAQYTIVLYMFLLIWLLYFKILFEKKSFKDVIKEKWALQFCMGLLLSFLLFYFGIGHFGIGSLHLGNVSNILAGCILYLVPSSIMCFLLIYLEIEDLEILKTNYLKPESSNNGDTTDNN